MEKRRVGRSDGLRAKAAPFGWAQDAVDGALLVLLLAGNLRATGTNGSPVQAQAIPQNQVGVTSFYVDVPPLTVQERAELRALFQKAGRTSVRGPTPTAATVRRRSVRASSFGTTSKRTRTAAPPPNVT